MLLQVQGVDLMTVCSEDAGIVIDRKPIPRDTSRHIASRGHLRPLSRAQVRDEAKCNSCPGITARGDTVLTGHRFDD
ncbi:hypothetical protein EVAR_27919_1 [Eumeta japonica]|uniref:Uncharacterized protein n=1 Tax=Eumeta variegata TaxID=151549 RepID=A0A4C1UV45_EUMVA|nr:hypothetical protein EVAR_27919_1 [Eumeta japonica]